MKKSSLKCTFKSAADRKSRQHFQDEKIMTGTGLRIYSIVNIGPNKDGLNT